MNYLELRTQFLALVNRTDCTDTLAKLFFQQGIQRCQRELRLPHMERLYTIDTSVADVSEIIVPPDWVQTIAFVVSLGNGLSMEVDWLDLGSYALKTNRVYGLPTYYTRKFDKWLVHDPIPKGATAYIAYYGSEAPLVNDTDEPTLAKIAPDLLTYAALTYATDYFIDDRGPAFESKWTFFREQMQSQAADGELSNGSSAVQPAYQFDDGVSF